MKLPQHHGSRMNVTSLPQDLQFVTICSAMSKTIRFSAPHDGQGSSSQFLLMISGILVLIIGIALGGE